MLGIDVNQLPEAIPLLELGAATLRRVERVNGISLAIMVLGKDFGQRLIAATPGVDGLIVDRDGAAWLSQGMRARLRPAR